MTQSQAKRGDAVPAPKPAEKTKETGARGGWAGRAWGGARRVFSVRRPRKETWWNRFPNIWWTWFFLLAITGAGGFLRFWRIDHQSYWYDEARTVYRIWGTQENLLDLLARTQGFPPGWYLGLRWWSLLMGWWRGSEAWALSPAALRLLPALLGTLMIPVMYLLARQFTDRKGALLATLLTAANPYLIYYSRDIKMYMALWFFSTLNIALFFKWLTTQRHWLYWPLFVLSGAGMLAMHAIGFFVVVLELIWLLTRPRLKSLDGMLWLIGVGVMSLIPLWWYVERNEWVTSVAEGRVTGVEWNQDYTSMEWSTVLSVPTMHLLGYLLPKPLPNAKIETWFGVAQDFNQHLSTRTLPWAMDAQYWAAIALGAILVLGLVPWRGMRTEAERKVSATRGRWWWFALWIGLPVGVLALTWIPRDSPWYQTIWVPLLKMAGKPNGMTPVWEPRYLGIIIPAWILWLAAALRRFPTWPVRTVLIVAVVGASVASGLVNHLAYRQIPWGPTAAAIRTYVNPKTYAVDRLNVAVATPGVRFPGAADEMAYEFVEDIRASNPAGRNMFPNTLWKHSPLENQSYDEIGDNAEYQSFLDRVRSTIRVKTIILTDRNGDLTTGPLTDAAISQRLGAQWKLVSTERYRWFYEWRFYLFDNWRTRVWVRVPPAPPGPASGRAR